MNLSRFLVHKVQQFTEIIVGIYASVCRTFVRRRRQERDAIETNLLMDNQTCNCQALISKEMLIFDGVSYSSSDTDAFFQHDNKWFNRVDERFLLIKKKNSYLGDF